MGKARRAWSFVWRHRASWIPFVPAVGALIVAMVLVWDANRFFFEPTPALLNSMDEGYATAFGRRMVEGRWLPYVDAVSHRGPVYYWVTAVLVKTCGWSSWLAMRVGALSCILLTLGLGFSAALVAKRSLAAGVMVLVYASAVLVSMGLGDGLAFNSEHVLNVFGMLSFLCIVLGLRRETPHAWLLFVSAASAMLGALAKQVGLVLLVPLFAWTLAAAVSRPGLARRVRVRVVLAFLLGAAVPLFLLVLRYTIAGELGTLYFYLVRYNTEIYVGGLGSRFPKYVKDSFENRFDLLLIAAPIVGYVLSRLFARARGFRDLLRAYDERGLDTTVDLSAIASLLTANGSWRNFGHYYVQVLPWAALFGGILIERLAESPSWALRRHWVRTTLVRAVILLPVAALAIVGWSVRVRTFQREGAHDADFGSADWPLCTYLNQNIPPHESLFVWGFAPAPYTACNRKPASRYVYTTFVAGFVPFLDDPREVEEKRVAPGSREILLHELEASKPGAIIDAANSIKNRSIMNYPGLKELVLRDYCRVAVNVGGPNVWVRRDLAPCAHLRR
jgi:4-amino-4-deoxy-L-arabinose transferase-like glycosyltransferase